MTINRILIDNDNRNNVSNFYAYNERLTPSFISRSEIKYEKTERFLIPKAHRHKSMKTENLRAIRKLRDSVTGHINTVLKDTGNSSSNVTEEGVKNPSESVT